MIALIYDSSCAHWEWDYPTVPNIDSESNMTWAVNVAESTVCVWRVLCIRNVLLECPVPDCNYDSKQQTLSFH